MKRASGADIDSISFQAVKKIYIFMCQFRLVSNRGNKAESDDIKNGVMLKQTSLWRPIMFVSLADGGHSRVVFDRQIIYIYLHE